MSIAPFTFKVPRSPRRFRFKVALQLIALGLCSAVANAQGTVPLKTVVTDQSQLNLSNLFGTPAATAIDQQGDFSFIGEGRSALFVRSSGATSITRLLQNGDAVPGIADSSITSFVPAIFESQAGILFAVNFNLADGSQHQAILIWSSGTTYTTIATDTTPAPGTNTTYGSNLQLFGINDAGDVAFGSVPSSGEMAVFITPAGGSAKRIFGTGDSISFGASNIVLSTFTVIPGINARGQLLFYSPGSTSSIYSVADKTGQITVVADNALPAGSVGGGCNANTSGLEDAVLNNSGVVAFVQNPGGSPGAICYATVGSPANVAVTGGANAPNGLTGTLSSSLASTLALDDSGDIVFEAEVGSTMALLRFTASTAQVSTIAYQGETDLSGTGQAIFSFDTYSIAADGTATFFAPLAQGNSIGLYQQSGTGTPAVVTIQGASAPENLGGTIDLEHSAISAETLSDHSVFFSAPIAGGSAYFADFLATPGTPTSVRSLVSTADPLPSGSRVQLSTQNATAGDYVGFAAQNPGGRTSLFVSNVSSGTNTSIITEGDAAPETGGVIGLIKTVNTLGIGSFPPPVPFYVNANGQAAFDATLAGSASSSGIFLHSPSAGLTKIMASNDTSPRSGTFGDPLPLQKVANPLNDNGQVAFAAENFQMGPKIGIYRVDPDGTVVELVITGDPGPNGGTFYVIDSSISPIAAMNESGSLAFQSYALSGSHVPNGFYEGDGTSTPQPVAIAGAKIVNSTQLFNPGMLSDLNDNGTLSFMGEAGSTNLMVGTAAAPGTAGVTAIAVNGAAAPAGGAFNFGPGTSGTFVVFPGLVQSNAENDVAFWAGLNGGNSTSGLFLSPGTGPNAGVLQSLALQGESVPSGGTLNDIPLPYKLSGAFALGADGQLLFSDSYTNGSTTASGLFLARTDGSLVKVLAAGDALSVGGTSNGIQIAPGLAAGAPGTFAFWSGISGGSAHQAIFVTQIPAGTSVSTTTVTSSSPSAPQGTSVTLTATVTSSAQGTPTGTITFFDGGTALGQAITLANAPATFEISSLATGSHSITAQYSGDATFAPSTSAVLTQVVEGPPDFSVSASPSPLTITAGQSGQITVTVTPINGSTQTVTFSCSGLPALATCQANPASITLDGTHSGTSTITIQTTAASLVPAVRMLRKVPPTNHHEVMGIPVSAFAQSLEISLGILILFYLAQSIRKRRFGTVALWIVIAGVALAAGCGGGGNGNGNPGGGSGGTPAGTYPITLTISAGGTSHTATASIIVTR